MGPSWKSRELIGITFAFTALGLSLAPPWIFLIALAGVSLVMSWELSKALSFELYPLAPVVLLMSAYSLEMGTVALFMSTLWISSRRWDLDTFFKTFFIQAYCGLLPSYIFAIKSFGGLHLIKLLFFVWVVDTASYYVGKTFGKTPLASRLSPKKTWEGLLGGILAGMLYSFFAFKNPYLGALLALVALGGDLFKSFIKRQVGIKDFSNILGEHGGFTDRLDSLLMCAPVYLHYLKIVS